jgi:predicted kinase
MEGILLIGIQASGKTTFYNKYFFNTHIRISNDQLKTKNRERLLLEFCKNMEMSFVIDNTNVTKEVRLKYIKFIKEMNIPVIGYYFKTDLKLALQRNSNRIKNEKVPDIGILSMHKKLQIPSYDEGFNKLYYVDNSENKFNIQEWQDEI